MSEFASFSNINSKLCNNALKGKACKKKSCGFAHSMEDFSPISCSCVYYGCKYFHPHKETKEMFLYRYGINYSLVPAKILTPTGIEIRGSLEINFGDDDQETYVEKLPEGKTKMSEEEERKINCLVNNISYTKEEYNEEKEEEEVMMTIVIKKKNLEKILPEIQKINCPIKLIIK